MKNAELKKIFKNKYVIRVAAGAVTIAMLGTGAGAYTVYAQKTADTTQESSKDKKTENEKDVKETEKKLVSTLSDSLKNQEDAGKEETVYVVANADGSADNVIVSEWLKNKDGKESLKDASDLKDITNVKGEETFTQSGTDLTWDAKGKDIYYQGTTEKELPVTEKVTYYLDGKEMKPEEIAGKSGKVTIRFDYTNNAKTTETVDGKKHEVYVPFTVMTGMILPEDYSNVEVTNGKVISDGSKKVVVGLAMPGMQKSLGIEKGDLDDDVEIPEYVEVTADVEDFSLDMTMTVAMSDLLGGADLSEAFDLSGLEEDMDTLSDSAEQLVDGSTDLADGLKTLKTSMKEFASGVSTLKSGVANYTDGAAQLNSGIGTLKEGTGSLTQGAGTLAAGVSTISENFTKDGGLVNGAKALKDGVNQLDKSLKTAMTEEEKGAVKAQADQAVESTFKEGASAQIAAQASGQFEATMKSEGTVSAIYAGLEENLYDSLYGAAYAQKIQEICQAYPEQIQQIVAGTGADTTKAAEMLFQQANGGASLSDAVSSGVKEKLQQLASGIAAGIAANGKDAMGTSVADACKEAAKTAAGTAAVTGAEGAKSTIASQIEQGGMVSGAAALSDGVGQMYTEGIKPLKDGVDSMVGQLPTLTAGIDQLAEGSSTLVSNNGALNEGASKLSDATSQLTDGVDKLEDGSGQLMEGMVKFDEEGIQKLVDAYNGDAKTLLNKLKAVVNAGKDYQTFTKVADGTKGSVKFILRTDAVKAEEK